MDSRGKRMVKRRLEPFGSFYRVPRYRMVVKSYARVPGLYCSGDHMTGEEMDSLIIGSRNADQPMLDRLA
jgi:hypothetical protein